MDILNLKFNEYNFSIAWLMAFGNLEISAMENHMGFDIDVRSLEGTNNLSGFMKYFEAYMTKVDYDEEYTILDSRQIAIKGKSFELREFLVTQYEYRDYHILSLCCQVNDNYFLCVKVDFWADNAGAKEVILESVSNGIEFY